MIMVRKIKDPRVAAVVALAVLGWVGCYGFIPAKLRRGERAAIIDTIRDIRQADLPLILDALEEDPDNPELLAAAAVTGRESIKEIAVTDATVRPRGFGFSKKVRIAYTAGGETPELDGGVRYFRIRHSGEGSSRHAYRVYEISRERYGSWW